MKCLTIALLFGLFCIRSGAQTTDLLLDSLKRPLPKGSAVQQEAERLKNILQHILRRPESGFGNYPQQLDSLYQCCIAGKTGNSRFETWVGAVASYYLNADNFDQWEQGKQILQKVIGQFEATGDSNMVATALVDLTYYAVIQNDTASFYRNYERAMNTVNSMNDLFLRWRVYMEMGNFSCGFGKYAQGMQLYFKAIDATEQYKTPLASSLLQDACIIVSYNYLEFDNFEQALLFAQRAIQLGKESGTENSLNYYALGRIYQKKKDFQNALQAYNSVKSLSNEPYLIGVKSNLLVCQAVCYRNLGYLTTALTLVKQALELLPVSRMERVAAVRELAECELAAGRPDAALHLALEAHKENLAGSINEYKSATAQLLSRIYKAKGDFQKALEYNESAQNFINWQAQMRQIRQIAVQEFERENAAANARREADVQAQFTRQRNIRYALLASLGVLALLAFLLYTRFRLKQRTAAMLEAKNREIEAARTRAEASEAFKSRFLANMSHEIRTPLHGIAGFTDLLLDTSLSEKQRRYLKSIHHSTDRLTEVVNDILDLSKLEAGEVKLRQIPFSPAQIAQDVLDSLSLRAESKGIELQLDLDEKLPAVVLGDPTRLYQVLMNLTGNAVKFTEKGAVRLTLECEQASAPDHASSVPSVLTFHVSDTGIGIAPERLATVFDSFQQASEDTTARFGGTGLGLTIARELVQLHGADIQVKSEAGKGSEFSFSIAFPLCDDPGLEKETAPESLYFDEPLAILLADDNAFNREIATEALLRHFSKAHIVEASTGLEALESLENQDFNLILMDMQMPEMNGIEAARHIRQRFSAGKRHVPIIALTASATPEEIKRALEAGMNRHLAKPFKPAELASAVVEALGLKAGEAPTELENALSLEPPTTSSVDLVVSQSIRGELIFK